MATTTTLDTLKINYLTQAQYDTALANDEINENELYLTPQSGGGGISSESDPVFSASAAAGITSSDITNWNGKTSNTGTVTSITLKAGGGITLDTDNTAITGSGSRTISHTDTSSQASVSNSGRTYIQSVTLDTYGHVTALTSATETVTDSDEKLKITDIGSESGDHTSYLIFGNGTTAMARQYDTKGLMYQGVYGSGNGTAGKAYLTLGNNYSAATGANKQGKIILYGSTAYAHTIEGAPTAARTITLPDKTGTVALTSDIPTVPTKVSDLTNDSGFLTSADIPEGASAYTGTISAVGTSASSGSSNGFARGDHVHNITKTTIDTQLGTGSGTTKFYREDGTWATPAYTTNTDENVKSTAVTAATTNYIVGSTTSTTTTGGLSKHASAVLYTTADSGTSGYTQLRLGNITATSSAGGKEGQIRLYGTNATYYVDLKPGAIASSNKTITFPNATGTVALTSDIPSVPTSAASHTTGVTVSDHGTTSVGSASNWSAGSGSYSATVTSHVLSFSHTHTAPSLTVTSTTVVNGKSHTVNDSGHTHTLS